MTKDMELGRGRVPDGTGLSSSTEPQERLGHSGFDPSRGGERVRVILDCNWRDLQHALDMVIDARPSFDRLAVNRVGWGWNWSRHGKPSLFVRRTKRGYSANAARDSDRHPEGGDALAAPSRSDESAVPERQSPEPSHAAIEGGEK